MKKSTFRIIAGITTIVAGGLVTVSNLLGWPAAVSGIIVAVSGMIDEICSLFIKEQE